MRLKRCICKHVVLLFSEKFESRGKIFKSSGLSYLPEYVETQNNENIFTTTSSDKTSASVVTLTLTTKCYLKYVVKV